MKFTVLILALVAASLADTSSAFVVVHPVATSVKAAVSGRSSRQHQQQQQKGQFIDTTTTTKTTTVLYKGMWTEDDEIQGLDRFKS